MKKVFITLLASASIAFSSCQKEQDIVTMDGEWYIRAILEESTKRDELVSRYYKMYKRSDVYNKYYKTITFSGNSFVITTYDRDKESNKNTVSTITYPFAITGDNMTVTLPDGSTTTYNYKFYGLGSRSLQLGFINTFVNNNNETIVTTNKTVLLREFPKDDSEEEKEEMTSPGEVGGGEDTDAPPPIGW